MYLYVRAIPLDVSLDLAPGAAKLLVLLDGGGRCIVTPDGVHEAAGGGD
jgi:hypothetical protein